ncbi:hypothetical protein [Cypionkella sp.]|uniref:hypothetical protein n=1 Tax=Cypionkella sp. TaxID=2811411 RepID=UPI002AB9C336|nr:hypothetical protein [Cypionkella sp.]MDZ4392046.1 hypothetical protein [Cypionkella sp.]
MPDFFVLGVFVKDHILALASLLVGDAFPGLVVLAISFVALLCGVWAYATFQRRINAVNRLTARLAKPEAGGSLLQGREAITAWFVDQPKGTAAESLSDAWDEFNETLFIDETQGAPVLRNAVRPAAFFNLDDLHFGAGIFRVLPGVFVSVGLALTFLGLIAALTEMSQGDRIDDETMKRLLGIASAKFIMSLTGLVCSIVLTILFRRRIGALDHTLHKLCRVLEKQLTFASLEEIGMRQLAAMVEDREHHRQLTLQMIAEIGGPLKNELPLAISTSISTAMQPLLDKVSQQGSDSMSTMAADLSQQLSTGVGNALTAASERLATAGDKIGLLADRMDQSSGRMGTEMETAVARVAQAVDDLRGAMANTAQSTSGAFTQGAEQLLAAMNQTLEGIRDNTSEGARAISAAATDMREAAGAMRSDMETAAQSGADAARARMQVAGDEAGAAIGAAGQSMMAAFGKAGGDIARLTEELSAKAGSDLVQPIGAIADQLEDMVSALADSATEMRRLVDGVRDGAKAGAEAAGSFRGASQDLVAAAGPVRATSERIEAALRQMADGTRDAVVTVTQSARATAESAAQTLAAARETLAAERRGIDASLAAVTDMLGRMRGQGDRMDTIDQKLGTAFDLYTTQTEQAMQSVRSHVEEMSKGLNAALATLQTILDGLQEFQPQQVRR